MKKLVWLFLIPVYLMFFLFHFYAYAGLTQSREVSRLTLVNFPQDVLAHISFKSNSVILEQRLEEIGKHIGAIQHEQIRELLIKFHKLFLTKSKYNNNNPKLKSLDFESKSGALLAFAQIFAIRAWKAQQSLEQALLAIQTDENLYDLSQDFQANSWALAITMGLKDSGLVVPWLSKITHMDIISVDKNIDTIEISLLVEWVKRRSFEWCWCSLVSNPLFKNSQKARNYAQAGILRLKGDIQDVIQHIHPLLVSQTSDNNEELFLISNVILKRLLIFQTMMPQL